jgi:tetratricopeptide (TPR) repeat protein
MNRIESFEKLLASGQDTALLRYSLGMAYHAEGRLDEAVEHLARAVAADPAYSAAWKAYGKVLAEAGRRDEAAGAFERGVAVAEEKGDIQAAKEMKVFLKRLMKST